MGNHNTQTGNHFQEDESPPVSGLGGDIQPAKPEAKRPKKMASPEAIKQARFYLSLYKLRKREELNELGD